jgi:uncharacterized protein
LMRILGFDTLFFKDGEDSEMISQAISENRIVLTRDSHILERRPVTHKQLKALLVHSDNKLEQINQVVQELELEPQVCLFSLCLECNAPLHTIDRSQVESRVPEYVFRTQFGYVECPQCHRIYWKGTHWQAMTRRLENLKII